MSPQWVGGQAVLEGVMMRCQDRFVVACRRSDNSISLIAEKKVPLAKRFPPLGWPILRGAVSFFESLILGVHAINLSAAEVLPPRRRVRARSRSRAPCRPGGESSPRK